MDTKWKNRGLLISLVLLFTFALSGILPMLSNGNSFLKKDYFHTGEFESELMSFVDYLSRYELNPITKEKLMKNITVTDEEINQYRIRYGDLSQQISSIKAEYDPQIESAQSLGQTDEALILSEEKAKKIKEIQKSFNDNEYVKQKILTEKQKSIENYLKQMENEKSQFLIYKSAFTYYLKNPETGEVYTNMTNPTEEGIQKSNDVVFLRNYPSSQQTSIQPQEQTIYNEENDLIVAETRSEGKLFVGQIAVIKSDSSNFFTEKNQNFKERKWLFIIYSILSIAAFVFFFYLFKRTKEIQLEFINKWRPYYKRIPFDIQILFFLITVGITMGLLGVNSSTYIQLDIRNEIERIIQFMWITPLIVVVYLQGYYLLEMRRNFKEVIKASLLYKINRVIKEAFLNRRVSTQLLVLVIIILAIGACVGLVIAFADQGDVAPVFLLIAIIIGMPVGFIIIRQVGYFNRILAFIHELEKGEFHEGLPNGGKSILANLSRSLNAIQDRLKMSQGEQAKSERLKVELITNVSHDLRTPLTSIITYTELLKQQSLDEDDRQSYIQIIDRKSKRLKVLIDDLFEVSKMASGNIELNKEKVDINQLLEQALAEYNETIEESTLEFRVTKPETPVYALVDGQKIWRVFDNLIGNITKYSLAGTRVYISVEESDDNVNLIFKNISKYELGGNTDEMLERFKRGDTSRHTEGSGLGLAIAKSIIDLHGGRLEIEADGDLFKVVVVL